MIDDIKITASGTTEPVTTAEAKAFLKVDYTDSDDLIDDLISSAREFIESYCEVSLVNHSVEVESSGKVEFQLPYYPVDSSTIAVVDENSASVSFTRLGDEKPYIYFTGASNERYTISYDTTANTDTSLKVAVLHLVKWLFDNSEMARSNVGFTSFITDKMNIDAMRIMDNYRLM